MLTFYRETIAGLLKRGQLQRSMSVLVVCGGSEDKDVFEALGFSQVTISNVDSRMNAQSYLPFAWAFQDAEQLGYADDSFDFVVVHSGLHHCHSPHRALLEMYRVARIGVVMFEPYDNVTTRLGVAVGLGQEHEHAASFLDDEGFGGVRNTEIPNYVYRFTEREIEKTMQSYEPLGWHRIEFLHALRIPWEQLKGRKNKAFLALVVLGYPLLMLTERVMPTVCNHFAAIIFKLDRKRQLHPWLRAEESAVTVDQAWMEQRYSRDAWERSKKG